VGRGSLRRDWRIIGVLGLLALAALCGGVDDTGTAATCVLVPQLRDVTVNQGLGSYSPLERVDVSAVVCRRDTATVSARTLRRYRLTVTPAPARAASASTRPANAASSAPTPRLTQATRAGALVEASASPVEPSGGRQSAKCPWPQ